MILSGKDPDSIDDEELAPFYRRPKLVDNNIDNEELSDYVSVRLALIRVKALHKYREVCYNRDSQELNT